MCLLAGRLCRGTFFPHKAEDKDAFTEPSGPSDRCAQLDASISTISSSDWVCTSTFFGGM